MKGYTVRTKDGRDFMVEKNNLTELSWGVRILAKNEEGVLAEIVIPWENIFWLERTI